MTILLPEQVRLDIIQSARTMHASKGPRSPWKTHYFVDTEFTDFIDCQPISVAIVGEDGREFYGERTDFKLSACSHFVRAAAGRRSCDQRQHSATSGVAFLRCGSRCLNGGDARRGIAFGRLEPPWWG
jgi:hypothetical protein